MNRISITKTFPLCVSNININSKLMSKAWTSRSKSANLLLQSGLVFPCSTGIFHYSPVLLRSLEKLEKLIDDCLSLIGGQKLQMASLAPKTLWTPTKRWIEFGNELIKAQIGKTDYCLSPTHEEAICSIIASYHMQLSYMHLPLRLYQTTTKYRGEFRPHSGLLRCREFLMNDLYTFDINETSALETYDEVAQIYDSIFSKLKIEVFKAEAQTGVIGGSKSHEYHIKCDVGEDQVVVCKKTGKMFNAEHKAVTTLPANEMKIMKGIEVGHLFLLGQKYSEILKAVVNNASGKLVPTEMGCYGLGVSRILASCLEVLSTEKQMRWPTILAPYKICLIPPKSGSKEEASCGKDLINNLYDSLQSIHKLRNEVIIDDRTDRTIGYRYNQANVFGYPLVIIIGKSIRSQNPTLEIVTQGKTNITTYLPPEHIIDFVKKHFSEY